MQAVPFKTPDHVPESLVFDFDFYNPGQAGEEPFTALARLHDCPRFFWTPRNQGHWVATRGADIKNILQDVDRFSSRFAFIPVVDRPAFIPLEIDPPEHIVYRKLIMPAFHPPKIKAWSSEAAELAAELIDKIRPRGECEFISEFAEQLPIIIFMKMIDLPMQDREMLLSWVNESLRPKAGQSREAGQAKMQAYVADLVQARFENPGNDVLSQALHADMGEGRKLTVQEANSLTQALVGGGLDTVAASMGWAAKFLAENPEKRLELVENPDLINNAVNELLRRYSVPNIARLIRQDMEYEGVTMKAGEQIFLSSCVHGLDEREFENARIVDFTRSNARGHCTFSQGIHKCPGQVLAQQELRIFVKEWLSRIPDFRISTKFPPEPATGIVHGLRSLHLEWDI